MSIESCTETWPVCLWRHPWASRQRDILGLFK